MSGLKPIRYYFSFENLTFRERLFNKHLVLRVFSASLIISLLYLSEVGDRLLLIVNKVNFAARSLLHQTPIHDPKIKIFSLSEYDPSDIPQFNPSLPEFSEWIQFLRILSAQKPKAIFINHILPEQGPTQSEIDQLFPKEKGFAPIFFPSVFSDRFVTESNQMFSSHGFFGFRSIYRNIGRWFSDDEKRAAKWTWTDIKQHESPPSRNLLEGFSNKGHIIFLEGGYTYPFLWNTQTHVTPHLALFAGDYLDVDSLGPILNGHRIHLDWKDRLLINYVDPDQYLFNMMDLKKALKSASLGYAEDGISAGDIVIISPEPYGHSMLHTPIGKVPSDFVFVSMINTAIKGTWFEHYNCELALIWILAALAFIGSVMLPARFLWLWGLSLPVLVPLIGVIGFSYFNTILPVLFPFISAVFAQIITTSSLVSEAERKTLRMGQALKDNLPPEQLQHAVRDASYFKLDASEQIVSIMCIEFTGFASAASSQPTEKTIAEFKLHLELIKKVVHLHGGMTDRIIGDSIICLFGCRYEPTHPLFSLHENHAEVALLCGREIAHEVLNLSLIRKESGDHIYPIRIGINTAPVFFGNLGQAQQIDLALIGSGIGFAKRLTSNCDHYKIMLSSITRSFLQQNSQQELHLRYIRLRHSDKLIESHEYNPFRRRDADVKALLAAYNKSAGIQRKSQRFAPQDDLNLSILMSQSANKSTGQIVDFSADGLAIKLTEFYATGAEFKLHFDPLPKDLKDELEAHKLTSIISEVRWGRIVGENYLHGLLITGLSRSQKEQFVTLLSKKAKKKES